MNEQLRERNVKLMVECVICGKVIDNCWIYDLSKAVCLPPSDCQKKAMANGWRMDGAHHGISKWEPIENPYAFEFMKAMARTANRVVEWGAGYSTWELPKHVDGLDTWLAIDTQRYWAHILQWKGLLPGVAVMCAIAEEYVDFPRRMEFDEVIIDGVYRQQCLEVSKDILAPGGVVFAHDAEPGGEKHWGGAAYDFSMYPHEGWFEHEYVPPGTTLGDHEPVYKRYVILAEQPLDTLHCKDAIEKYVEVKR